MWWDNNTVRGDDCQVPKKGSRSSLNVVTVYSYCYAII